MRPVLALGVAALLAGCGGGTTSDAEKLAAKLSGEDKGAAATNPQCAMYSQAEIAAFAGEAVGAGKNAGSGFGCQWLASDGIGSTIVTVAPASNHVVTDGAEGFRDLPDVGSKGFVAGKPGGWAAGAITGDKMVAVSIDSNTASEANTVALLKQTLAKVQG